jgi:hypothetical protein
MNIKTTVSDGDPVLKLSALQAYDPFVVRSHSHLVDLHYSKKARLPKAFAAAL